MSPTRQSKQRPNPARRGPQGARTSPHVAESDQPPLFVFSRRAIRALDEAAVAELGIPSLLLMEHASLSLVDHVVDLNAAEAGVLIVCGKGNNAGDGLALARHLHVRAIPTSIVLPSDASLKGDADINLTMVRRLNIPVFPLDMAQPDKAFRAAADSLGSVGVTVDAISGTGLSGPPRDAILAMIRAVNDRDLLSAPVLAVDIPSGMDADTGAPAGTEADVVRADRTVTFVGLKTGFLTLDAQPYLGDIYIEGIGTPESLAARYGEALAAAEAPGKTADGPIPHAPRRPGQGPARGERSFRDG